MASLSSQGQVRQQVPRQFHGGDEPDQVDISYYGTVAPFHVGEDCVVAKHLADSGLEKWFEDMMGTMPAMDD